MTFGPQTLKEARKYTYKHYYGKAPKSDFVEGQCIAAVSVRERWGGFHQCNKKAVVDGGWCKQHDPAAVAAREAVTRKKYDDEWDAKQRSFYYAAVGEDFEKALEQIAAGHNDARKLAKDVLTKAKKEKE